MKNIYFFIVCIFFFNLALNSQEDQKQEEQNDTRLNQNLSLSHSQNIDLIEQAKGAALRWKLQVGDVIEIRKKSYQDIKITDDSGSRTFLQSDHVQRDVIHRVVLNTIAIEKEKGYLIEGSFNSQVNYKQNQSGLYQEEDNQESVFYIQPRGTFLIPPGTYMPNVRDIPVFPELNDPNFPKSSLKNGDSWTYPGMEIMKADELEIIPLNVVYEYRGSEKVKKKGEIKVLHKILYNIEFNHKFKKTTRPENPKQMFGYVTAKLTWDESAGIPYYMTEDYDLVIMYNNGVSHEFKILSKTNYLKKQKLDNLEKDNIRNNLEENLAKIKDGNVSVESTKQGISIQIPDILFHTNASDLTLDKITILSKIGKVLKKYIKNHQVLVRGHTDNVGNIKYNNELSIRRAESVAKYLFDNLEIPVDSLSYEGVGSRFPISDNTSPSGRAKNRRVEIILLDY